MGPKGGADLRFFPAGAAASSRQSDTSLYCPMDTALVHRAVSVYLRAFAGTHFAYLAGMARLS